MTTAEKYRQLEKSPSINIARYIFQYVKNNATNSTLGNEIIEIKTGKTPSKQNKRFYEDDYFNWFKPDEIGSEKYLFEAKDKLSKFAFENNQVTVYEPDTILINAIGDIGRVSILKVKASSNQQITGIRLNDKIDVDYAYFYLLANRHFFYVDLFQTTLPIVNQKKINSIPFVYPRLEEQRKIVEGLVEIDKIKSVDDLYIIEKLNWNEEYKNACRNFFSVQFNSKDISIELTHQLTLVKKLRQQLLQDAVKGILVPQNPKDEPAIELLKKIKAEKAKLISEKKTKSEFKLHQKSKLNHPYELPNNWEWVRFWEIAWCFRGHNPEKIHFKKEPGEGYIRFIQITDFKTDERAVYVPISKQLKLVSKGEIVMAAYRHIGKFSREMEGAFNVALCKVNNIEPFSRDFLSILIKSDLITGELLAASERGHIPSMHTEHLLSLWVPVPPLSEQNRIVQKLEELMQYCNELEVSIKESESQNEKLLQQVLKEALRKDSLGAN